MIIKLQIMKFQSIEKCDNARRYAWFKVYEEKYKHRIHVSILYTIITGLLIYNYMY